MAGAGGSDPARYCYGCVLRSSPAWNGRCWQEDWDGVERAMNVAILTGLEWPVLVAGHEGM